MIFYFNQGNLGIDMTPEAMVLPAVTRTSSVSCSLPTYSLEKIGAINGSFYINAELEAKLLEIALDTGAFAALRRIILSLPSSESGSNLLFKEAPGIAYSGLTMASTKDDLHQMANDIETFLSLKSTRRLKRERLGPVVDPILNEKRARAMGADDSDTHVPSLSLMDSRTVAETADGDLRPVKIATAPVATKAHIAWLREEISNYKYLAPGVMATGPLVEMLRRADAIWDKMASSDSLTIKQKIHRATLARTHYQHLAMHEQTSLELREAFLEEVQEVEEELKTLQKAVPPREMGLGKMRVARSPSVFFKENTGMFGTGTLKKEKVFGGESKFCVLATMDGKKNFDDLCKAMLVFEGGLLGKLSTEASKDYKSVDYTPEECGILMNILSYQKASVSLSAPPKVFANFSLEDFTTLVTVVNGFGAQIIEEFRLVNRSNSQSYGFSKEAVGQLQVILSPFPPLYATLSWPAPGGSPGLFPKPGYYVEPEATSGAGAFAFGVGGR